MIGKDVEAENMVTLNEVRDILEERKKKKELTYEQQLAYEHAKRASGMDKAAEKKLQKALAELGVEGKAAVKVIDILPKTTLTLKQILMHENRTFSDEEIAKILAAVKGSA